MTKQRRSALITVETEEDTASGWLFTVRMGGQQPAAPSDDDASRTIALRLSWADYEYWSGAAVSPARVARAVVEVGARELGAGELPDTVDAARVRRMVDGFDDRMREHLVGANPDD